jgi:glutamate racemase
MSIPNTPRPVIEEPLNARYDTVYMDGMEKSSRNTEYRQRPIAVYDSGVGGLPYLHWLQERLPAERFVYLADHDHFPYGEKPIPELRSIIPDAVGRLIAASAPKMVVIACNTASVVALAELRSRFGIPFVGVVPAVKPAAEHSRNCRIGIFATRRTIEDPYTDDLVSRFASHCRIARYAEGRIVHMVEQSYFSSSREQRRELLRPAADYFIQAKVDHLILACTHFVYLKKELEELLEGIAEVIDSRDGVGRQVMRILQREELAAGTATPAAAAEKTAAMPGTGELAHAGGNQFYITGKGRHDQYRSFAAHFGLEWGGSI